MHRETPLPLVFEMQRRRGAREETKKTNLAFSDEGLQK